MGTVTLKLDDARMQEVVTQLDRAGKLHFRAVAALTAAANILVPVAKQMSPVRTGRMRDSIHAERSKKSSAVYAVDVGVNYADAPYAHLVEHGHGGEKAARAHPFMEPAIKSVEDQVYRAIMEELTRDL